MSKTKAQEKYLNYLLKMYEQGGKMSEKHLDLLRRNGLIERVRENQFDKIQTEDPVEKVQTSDDWSKQMCPFFYNAGRYKKMNPVKSEDWKPESLIYHKKEFVDWINSMLYGAFPNRIFYKLFDIYKAQAWQWLQDTDNITNHPNPEARRAFIYREYDRCTQNTLYFANKYGQLKEGDIESGMVDFQAREHQAIILYLFDCGYSVVCGKGRQVGLTSVLGLAADKKLIYQPNYYLKFITEDADTGEEIFTDKIKYPYSQLPKWMQPKVRSDAGRRFWLSNRKKKGQQGYPNSRVDVVAPKKTAINGGSPQLVLIDEIANIGILTPMLNEGRPTMYWNNPETGVFEMKRQVMMWSSGVIEDKGQGAYEREWYRILGLWENENYKECGFVPIFFSWHCRLSYNEYLEQKKWYYGSRSSEKDIDLETSKTQFHQHYPSNYKDMFLVTATTLVSRDIIEKGIERCRSLNVNIQPILGYFEPEYDEDDPMPPESDVPYRVIGAKFIPIDDKEDWKKGTTLMFQKPEGGWKHRYYGGIDPISTETGYSRMAGAIWDEYYKTVSCIVNYRKQGDHKYVFLQCLLMMIYYGDRIEQKPAPTLLEANIGTNFTDYVQNKGYFRSLIFNSMLPNRLSGGAREVGIDMKGIRADAIIEQMTTAIRTYHDRLYIKVIFDQLQTFNQTRTASGKESWQASRKANHYDDVLFAVTYAFIARQCYPHNAPTRDTINPNKFRVSYELERMPDGSLTRVPKKIPMRDVRREEIPENVI